ncbi:MAG: acyl-CoA dehydrogenase [Ilumatobacteraceae bacterium]|nr:acyl-CoA dehydrogenase [Ilumatobacteraceae bacterium]
MQFSFSPDQHEFAAGLRDLLEREFPASRLREVWEAGEGHDPALWSHLAEMGVLSMMVPEADGGLGGDFVDTILLVEELGRAGVPGPVVETMVLGALALGGTKWAAGVVDGTTPVTAALLGERYVPHANTAPLVLIAHGGAVELLEHPALGAAEVEGIDGGRHLSTLESAVTTGTPVDADLAMLTDAGALATAAYLLGLSSRMLAIAGDYARDRRQFGQPIGAFQAVKHLMADALLKVEFARPAIYRAAWSFTNDPADRARDVSMAKALVSDAALKAARSALQVHGAIGYTWECDLQLFMKKAWALAPAWGSATQHRRRVADAVLGPR